MSVQETSKAAYYDIKPKISKNQEQILYLLRQYGPMTNSELSSLVSWPINTVTPRTNELVKKMLVREVGRRPCSVTGRQAIVWSAVMDTLF